MSVEPDTAEAVAFLEKWSPEGAWILTAIVPDGGRTFTDTFMGAKRATAATAFIDKHQGENNLYFMVNPARGPLRNKAKKTDVDRVEWLHVDVDPRVGEEIVEERRRILKKLQSYEPAPTVIIDSGGGFQAFWKLEEPFQVGGDEGKASEIEAFNQQLEILLGGDHCFNVDRIMRLPGTVNVPGEKKRRKGRTASLSSLMVADWKNVYPLKRFTPAARLQTSSGLADRGPAVKISGNLRRLDSVDDLPDKVSMRTKMLIVQGDDPDDPTKYKSRSEALFAVCCELVRAEVDDDTIAAVLLDPDFGISASVLDKRRPEEYAARQIAQARENAINPLLMEFNGKHAVIGDDGGRCRIISVVQDYALKRERISRQSFEDFRNRYMNVKVQVGVNKDGAPIEAPAGKWWLEHPMRRQYDTIVFAPARQVEGAFNLWTGFACEAIPGSCRLYLKHIHDNICAGVGEHYEYVINWMARAVQQPDRPGEVAIVLRGKQGTGKGLFAKAFGALWGRHFLQVSDPKHLVGSFNAHLRDCVVLFGDEAFYAGDKKHESVLKMLITEETLAIEAKGVDVVASPNFSHLMLASNYDWVIPAGAEERRFLVLDVADDKMQDLEYFKAVRHELDNGGREALLHFLMSRDISEFEVRRVPKTRALQDQKQWTFTPEQLWWYERLADGVILPSQNAFEAVVSRDALQQDYLNFMHRHGYYQRRSAATALGKFLSKVCPRGFPRTDRRWVEEPYQDEFGQHLERRRRCWMYIFPPLDQLRTFFDVSQGGPYEWPVIDMDKEQQELAQAAGDSPF